MGSVHPFTCLTGRGQISASTGRTGACAGSGTSYWILQCPNGVLRTEIEADDWVPRSVKSNLQIIIGHRMPGFPSWHLAILQTIKTTVTTICKLKFPNRPIRAARRTVGNYSED